MQEKESKSNWHFKISMAKSVLRVSAGISLLFNDILTAGIFFIVAEVLGIIEEF